MADERTGVDVNGVWDGPLIDKAARWLEERNGPGELLNGGSDHCGRHAESVESCGACYQQRWRLANPDKIKAYADRRKGRGHR